MSIDVEELKSLSSVEKIELIGILWDDLDPQSIPISESTMWDRLDKKVTEG